MATRLDRTQVVDTALRLLNDVGLDGLTLRRIASELDVQAPALYWHFKNKQELLDEMATEMLRRMLAGEGGAEPAPSWQDLILGSCRALRATLLGYRDGAKVFSGTRLTDTGHSGSQDRYFRALMAAGFSLEAAVQAHFTAYSFTIGFVIEEQSVHPLPGQRDPNYDIGERAARIGADHSIAARAGAALFTDYESRFETGLRVVIAGIEHTLSPPAVPASGPTP
ncbi:TetR/AcrR family transcriptional regulator C-terminal domain-containing protein [Streptomyces sp. URMC 123]|uniref:TetR/AcrR family transcriptional regulator C-terminal domain-containing protein n=1 Tax=Streptomyces sp. URMC 123 TaxID=3423403 RepID=UPI003F1B3CF3